MSIISTDNFKIEKGKWVLAPDWFIKLYILNEVEQDQSREYLLYHPPYTAQGTQSKRIRNSIATNDLFKQYSIPKGENEKTGKHLAIVGKIVRAPKDRVTAAIAKLRNHTERT